LPMEVKTLEREKHIVEKRESEGGLNLKKCGWGIKRTTFRIGRSPIIKILANKHYKDQVGIVAMSHFESQGENCG